MEYKYVFDKDKCWWKNVCKAYNSRECNGCCIRYMKMHYLTTNALLTEKQQHPDALIPEAIDTNSFLTLFEIKENIFDFVVVCSFFCFCSFFELSRYGFTWGRFCLYFI